MRILPTSAALAAGTLLCLTISCSDGTGVDAAIAAVSGRYTLRTINERALPQVVRGKWVIELTMTLSADQRVIVRGFDYPVEVPGGPAPPPTFKQDVHLNGTYVLEEDRILLYSTTHAYVNLATGGVAPPDTLRIAANAGSVVNPLWVRYLYVREGR